MTSSFGPSQSRNFSGSSVGSIPVHSRTVSFSKTLAEKSPREGQTESPRPEPFLLPGERDLLVVSTVAKLLLFPSYRSTDFEVHRNWLAITNTLPISKWYYDTTSEWTLDYPPFFAYFEWVMSHFARWVDPRIVDLQNLQFDEWLVVAFQRTTVVLSELVMAVALLKFIRGSVDKTTQRIISASLFLHPGFIICDHIHFQYNAFMFGILLWSILMARNGNQLASGFLFAVLLNFKHIYMYLAPAYFIYLLRAYCLTPSGSIRVPQFVALANVVILAFILSFGPFALMGQVPQVLSRLFPFTRGLNHAYWAPNAWALVTALDRVLLKYAPRFGVNVAVNVSGVASTSRGLVGDTVFAVIPNIKPIHTFIATITFQAVFLAKLWRVPSYKSFVCALTLCGYTSFMFGWHVHEKAILLVLVPLGLIAAENHAHFRTFVIASVAGIFSLFPLLFTPSETPTKILYTMLWGGIVFPSLGRRVYEFPTSLPWVILDRLEKFYICGFPLLQLVVSVLPLIAQSVSGSTQVLPQAMPSATCSAEAVGPSLSCAGAGRVMPDASTSITTNVILSQMEFLPLMLTSVYCAVGLVWAFIRLGVLYLRTY